jgi:hypothetical protein
MYYLSSEQVSTELISYASCMHHVPIENPGTAGIVSRTVVPEFNRGEKYLKKISHAPEQKNEINMYIINYCIDYS